MLASHQRSHSISSPIAQSLPTSSTSLARPAYKTRRPSLTNHMSKFKDTIKERLQENVQAIHENVQSVQDRVHRRARSNDSRQNNRPYENHGVVISEPQLNGSNDSLPSSRLAPLGSGAIVVSTPQEALALSAQRGGYRGAPAAASAPSQINQYYRQQPEPVEEEHEYEECRSQKSPPYPLFPYPHPHRPLCSQEISRKETGPNRGPHKNPTQVVRLVAVVD